MNKLLKFKDFTGFTFLYNPKKCLKNISSLCVVLSLLLIVYVLPQIITSNVKRCGNYLAPNMVYVDNFDVDINILSSDEHVVRLYESKRFKTSDSYGYTFQKKEDICTFTRSVFYNNNFNGIVISVKNKKDIDPTIIGQEIKILCNNGNGINDDVYIKGKVVNFCYTDNQKEILPVYVKTTVVNYYVNENFIDLSLVKFEKKSGYFSLTYDTEINEFIDTKLYNVLENSKNENFVTPLNYTSNYTFVNRHLNSIKVITNFLTYFSYLFLFFSFIVLILMFNIDLNDRKNEINIRKKLGISEYQLNVFIILSSLIKLLFVVFLSLLFFILFILLLNTFLTELNLSNLKPTFLMLFFTSIIITLTITINNIIVVHKA